jgi:nicotinate dehydrogenase subunit A
MVNVTLKLNGETRSASVPPETTLLRLLRDQFNLTGAKLGCDVGDCGACTVIVDGKAIRSCITPVNAAQNRAVTTLEGLGSTAKPHALQRAFVEEQAAQCGFCMNGILMSAKALLDKNPSPSADEIRTALDPILCRCGSHLRVIRAIQRAAHATAHA